MTHVDISIGFGEAFDRLTILRLKAARLAGEKQHRAAEEARDLEARLLAALEWDTLEGVQAINELHAVNSRLWEIEDRLRAMDKAGDFGVGFVAAAKDVYNLNDERARLKQTTDLILRSDVREVKGYGDDGC